MSKPPMDLVPLRALHGCARVLEFGLGKWGRADYLTHSRGIEVFFAKMVRHLTALQGGGGRVDIETLVACDKETGLPEIDHLLSNVIMLRDILIERGALATDPKAAPEPLPAPPQRCPGCSDCAMGGSHP